MIRFDLLGRNLPTVLHETDLKRIGRVVPMALRIKAKGEVSLGFVGEKEMQKLNTRYMGKKRPTDVLSFPAAKDAQFREPGAPQYWGDLVVCIPYASREAKRRGIDPREEVVRLIVHGLLHLRGFDHRNEKEEFEMFSLQERLIEKAIPQRV
ncbi:rRNA maturation RNase YbeY [Candidatus Uhrbacteria bacterium]|nr:rRNA maturation RNase YbeY [Candidatus Uhrbacteria bacterium]